MSILKYIIAGAAVSFGIYYVTKENENGTSILEDVLDEAPEYVDRAKKYVELTIDQISERFHAAKEQV